MQIFMNKIKVALITNPKKYHAWHESIITDLVNCNFADIVLNLVITPNHQNEEEKIPTMMKLFLKIDSKFFKPSPNALKKINLDSLSKTIDTKQITDNKVVETLSDCSIDVIINLTDTLPSNNIIKQAKHGVWFLNHCDIDKIKKRPYGIWEILHKQHETVAVLRCVKNVQSKPIVIDKTSSCTDNLSYTRNINSIYWQSQGLFYNNLKLLAYDESLFLQKIESKRDTLSNSEINIPFTPPKNLAIVKFVVLRYFKKLIQVTKSFFYFNQWALIFYNNKDNSSPYLLENYKKIYPPKDRFWADPFIVKKNNKYYLFIEELIYKNKLGHLSVMEIDEDGNYTKPEKILVKDYHLSYPFVFEENGVFYMIPETSGNKDIQLYKAIDFPLKWELEKVLMKDVVAVDTTIRKENDIYWMFTNIKKHSGESKHVELNLFYNDKLLSNNWTPHPLNPVVTDVKTSRPAGNLFISDNKLMRPSQNCSSHYGYSLNISEIVKLDTSNFKENVVLEIKPEWDKSISCTHSFNSADKLFVGDIKIKRSRFFLKHDCD